VAAATLLARTALRQIVDFALPPRCPGCGIITPEPHSFCLPCWSSLAFLGEPCCVRCGLPFEFAGEGEAECAGCIAHPPAFDRMRGAVGYGETARAVALKLKYGGRIGVALLAPVPLHRWRIWKRGYNQAALIASALGRRTGIPVELELVERIKATPPLKGMGARERALAVRGAFRVAAARKERLRGRRVILVDDVFTSGATASACAAVLKRAGAARVDIICWARVVRTSED
jgi:predicted amidophosphoribosyltransferase